MILSFADERTAVFLGKLPKGFPSDLLSACRRKLGYLDAATTLDDLTSSPGNCLEALSGDSAGQHSIRVDDQFRVCSRWAGGNADNAEIVDYHWTGSVMIRRDGLASLSFFDMAPGPALPPLTPGEVLLEEFMRPLGLTSRGLAAEIGVLDHPISSIVNGSRGVTAETAILLGRRFDTGAELWMDLQTAHDLAVAREAMAA